MFARLADACRTVLASEDETFDDAAMQSLVALRRYVGGNGMHFVIDEQVFHGHPAHGPVASRKYSGHEEVLPSCIVDMFSGDPRWRSLVDVPGPTVFTQDSGLFLELRARLLDGGVRSMMIVPFEYRSTGAGYFAFFAKHDAFRLQPSDAAALHATCDAVGQSIVLRSHRLAMDQALRRYESLLEMSEECLFELDSDGAVLFVAPSWARLTGWPSADIVGRRLTSLLVDPPATVDAFLERAEPNLSLRCQVLLQTTGGDLATELFVQHRELDEHRTAIQGCFRPVDPATADDEQLRAALGHLSSKEQEVVLLLLDGHRVRGIADQLFLSQHTVRNHLKRIFAKLGVSSQGELVQLCRGSGRPGQRR